jgi:hypothetical protein
MKNFFISFSSQDLSLASFIQGYFSDLFQGKANFFLSDFIEPSEEWLNRVEKEIKKADGALFILTPASILRQWVNIECGALWALGKQIFPLICGSLKFDQVHRPLIDFQATKLADPSSVSKLIRKISAACGLATPPPYDADEFCKRAQRYLTSHSALPDRSAVVRALSLRKRPKAEALIASMLEIEPKHLLVRIVDNDMLSVSGNLKDSGVITLSFSLPDPVQHLVLEVSNTENIHACYFDEMVKVLAGNEPLLAFLESQRHPNDPQYILKQDGFFIYSLRGIQTVGQLILKLVFWRVAMEHVLFRFYFVRQ